LPLIGEHNIYNALAAVTVAVDRGVPLPQAAAALKQLAPADKRGQVLQLAGASIINDCYNSNPKALNAMVDALAAMPARRRILVAGEMLELGRCSPDLHRGCGLHAAERGVDFVLGVCGDAQHLVGAAAESGVAAKFVPEPEQAGQWLARNVRRGDAVLLKASRGVRLERALETWQARIKVKAATGRD
jgi:UDP-N-acetylmuramoyl-tripeptide--D-alanyl-D-alanine ligase